MDALTVERRTSRRCVDTNTGTLNRCSELSHQVINGEPWICLCQARDEVHSRLFASPVRSELP